MLFQGNKIIGIIGTGCRNTPSVLKLIEKNFGKYIKQEMLFVRGCPKGAGFIRNTSIANESECLIACAATDRTGGTEDTIKKFEKLNKGEIYVV